MARVFDTDPFFATHPTATERTAIKGSLDTAADRFADLKVSILDFITAQADRDAIRARTHTDDLTSIIHTAMDQIETARGGGTLYFPGGTYNANIVTGRGQNVHLQGDVTTSTVLRSYTAGGFAVFEKFEGVWSSSRRRLSHLTFDGTNDRCGLLVQHGGGCDTHGLYFIQCLIGFMNVSSYYGLHLNPQFIQCYVGAWLATLNGQQPTDPVIAALPQSVLDANEGHSGNLKFIAPNFASGTVGLYMGGWGGAPLTRVYGGQFENNWVGILTRGSDFQNFVPMTVEGAWFESNGVGTPIDVLGFTGVQTGDLSIGGGKLYVSGARLAWIEVLSGAAVDLGRDIRLDHDTPTVAAGGSLAVGRVVVDNRQLRHVAVPTTSTDGRLAAAYTLPPSAVLPVDAVRPGRHLAADMLAGGALADTPALFTTVGTTYTWGVADAGHGIPDQSTCVEISRSDAAQFLLAFNALTRSAAANTCHVAIFALKPIGADLYFNFYAQNTFTQPLNSENDMSFSSADVWTWHVQVQRTAGAATANDGGIWHPSGAVTFRMAGLNVLEFPSEDEAHRWIERHVLVADITAAPINAGAKTYTSADKGGEFRLTGGTQTFGAASGFPADFSVNLFRETAGTITVDGVDADYTISGPDAVTVKKVGTALLAVGKAGVVILDAA